MKFPKILHAKENKDDDVMFYTVDADIGSLLENIGDEITVGVYQLIGTQKVTGVADVQAMKRVRK